MRAFCRSGLLNLDRLHDKSVTLACDCLHKAGFLRVIAEGLPQLANRSVDTVFAVYENISSPQAFHDFKPSDKVPLLRHQQNQKFHRHLLEPDRAAIPAQFIAVTVQLEFLELNHIESLGEAGSRSRYYIPVSVVSSNGFDFSLLSGHQKFTTGSPRLHCLQRRCACYLGCEPVKPADEEVKMKVTGQAIAIFGAILFGTAFVSNAGAQCGSSPMSHVAPASWRLLGPSPGTAHFAVASYSLGFKTVSDNDADDEPIVGMWHVLFTAKGNGGGPPDGTPIDNSLIVLHSDKTEIMASSRPPQDGDICMGVWEKTGRSKYTVNHIGWGGYDTANAPAGIGNPSGPTRILEKIVLSPDGKHFVGTFTLDAHDTSGNLTAHIVGQMTGTRVTVKTAVSDLL